jgi:tripartite-type tricarboxylate transporter receptor subunit TctC
MNQILKLPDIQEKAAAGGAEIVGGTPEQAGMYLKSELAKFARLVKEANIRLE